MSVARPSTCFFCSFKQAVKPPSSIARRRFHVSPVQSKRRERPVRDNRSNHPILDDIKPLSKQDIQDNYSPEQAAAIELTQKNLKTDRDSDFAKRTNENWDYQPRSMNYIQNMTEIDPVLDKPVRQPWTNLDDNSRLKTDDEFDEDISKFMETMPENDAQAATAFQSFLDNNRITVGKESAEFAPRSALAPDNTQVYKDGSKKKTKTAEKSSDGTVQGTEEVSPALVRLMQMTGFNERDLRSLRVKSIISHRVMNQTRLGKIQKQYWLSIAGNQNGLLGIGEGKAEESAEAMIQSQYRAIRSMVPVMRYENRTIFGDVKGKSGATELELYNRPPGFGLRCQQYIWEMCRCAGIHDLAARVTRARNPMNTVKAAFLALQGQKDPEEIAKGRGKKLVDVRKVYYAGNV